jgi:hypothetical protein
METGVILANILDTSNSDKIFNEVKKIFSYHYDVTELNIITDAYDKVKKLFNGKFSGYKACNTNYHSLMHTMDALLACMRLVDGYNLKEGKMNSQNVINLLFAALLHDVGYIQEINDNIGTGAKYTNNHIERSIAFIQKNSDHFYIRDIDLIARLIKCTELKVDVNAIPFKDKNEKLLGVILGTADLIGQMADREYLEKLLFLYYEFKEAGIAGYDTEYDIIKKTFAFYEIIKERLSRVFGKIYIYAKYHFVKRYGIDSNLYMESINKNMNYIKVIMNDNKTNFRTKLRRGNLAKSA